MKDRVSLINIGSLKRKNFIRTGMLITLFLSICVIVVTIYGQNVGNFVISIEQEASDLGLSLSEDVTFEHPTVRLYAESIEKATNISGFDLPKNIVEGDGAKNYISNVGLGEYMAYSFYLKNSGEVKMSYSSKVTIEEEHLEVSAAFRLWVITETNGVTNSYLYAKEPNTGSFNEMEQKFADAIKTPITTFEEDEVFYMENHGFDVGDVTRYTIILWLEGDDPECIDDILGGYIRFQMQFECLYSEEE